MSTRKIQILAAALATFSQILAGCGSRANRNEAPLTHAYRLIDAHKDDEAIAYLNNICTPGDSTDNACLTALASAYAHKAGVRIQRFVGVITASKNLSRMKMNFDNSAPQGETSEKVDVSVDRISGLLSKFAGILEVYTAIPTIKNDDTPYLEEAIKIMDGLQQPRQVDALYRAILRVIYFKHIFAEELVGEGNMENLGPSCTFDFGTTTETLSNVSRILISVFDDLALASPSKAKSYANLSSELADETLALTTGVSSASVLDEAGNLYLKKLAIQQGLGKLLKCKGGQGGQ